MDPPHMAVQKQDDQHEHTFSSYVRIRDVVLKTYQGRWTIGRSGERGSGISVLPARHYNYYYYNPNFMSVFNCGFHWNLNGCKFLQKLWTLLNFEAVNWTFSIPSPISRFLSLLSSSYYHYHFNNNYYNYDLIFYIILWFLHFHSFLMFSSFIP